MIGINNERLKSRLVVTVLLLLHPGCGCVPATAVTTKPLFPPFFVVLTPLAFPQKPFPRAVRQSRRRWLHHAAPRRSASQLLKYSRKVKQRRSRLMAIVAIRISLPLLEFPFHIFPYWIGLSRCRFRVLYLGMDPRQRGGDCYL